MKIYDLKDSTPADIPGLVIGGIARVIAYSENVGTFPAQYVVNTAYLNRDDPIFIDVESGADVGGVSKWCEYPGLGG